METRLRHSDYKVGWICALPIEGAAAVAMLDERHPPLEQHPSDHNSYFLGRIGRHNVVIACLPLGRTGTHNAAVVASQMAFAFDSIKVTLMVGVGGGIPTKKNDVRLGDVVVSRPGTKNSGVVQYDFGRTVEDGQFEQTGTMDATSPALLCALSMMRIRHYVDGNSFPQYLSTIPPKMMAEFKYPGSDNDKLFQPDYDHVGGETCDKCDFNRLVQRVPRVSTDPVVHYGTVLSANSVMKHGATRESQGERFDALCFEMEAAGLMSYFRCAVVRSICDYSDTHKNKQWQPYAALAAAAYAKELLHVIQPDLVPNSESRVDMPISGTPLLMANPGAAQTPASFFRIQVLGLVDVLVRLTSFFIDSVPPYAQTDRIMVDLVDKLKDCQKILQSILLVVTRVNIKLGSEFERDIEDELFNLHKSLVKAYRDGVESKVFSPGPSQKSNIEYWLNKVVTRFIYEYKTWENGMQIRLHVLRTSPDAEHALTEQTPMIKPSAPPAPEQTIISRPIDTTGLVRLPCSWVSHEESAHTLVEFRHYSQAVAADPEEFSQAKQALEDTVLFLQGNNDNSINNINIPNCLAYYHDISKNRFVLLHALPQDYGQPRSLRDLLTNVDNFKNRKSLREIGGSIGETIPNNTEFVDKVLGLARADRYIRHPLNHRLRLANQLANSLLYVHSGRLVHKHISPENIMILTRAAVNKYASFPYALGDPLLVGFDRTRAQFAASRGYGEVDAADCLYHHPDRWGKISGFKFSMLHDIYSLGVVLLEIAVWDSMIVWLPKQFGLRRKRYIAWRFIREMFDQESGLLKSDKTARDVQELLINYAKRTIPPIMGQGYTNVVVACLSGEPISQKVDGFKEDGIGLLYMIHIISKLEKLCMS